MAVAVRLPLERRPEWQARNFTRAEHPSFPFPTPPFRPPRHTLCGGDLVCKLSHSRKLEQVLSRIHHRVYARSILYIRGNAGSGTSSCSSLVVAWVAVSLPSLLLR